MDSYLFPEALQDDPHQQFPAEPGEGDIRRFQELILRYYAQKKRPMPWRETNDAYAILVSEIMLQQTQVDRVRSKYQEFLSKWPTPAALAEAPLSEVLVLWQGLGYNRRARFLQEAAKAVVERFGGAVPESVEKLRSLPGVGEYTAAAVAAFAFGSPAVVVDTNVRRVIIHFFFRDGDSVSDDEVNRLVEKTLYRADPRQWYYALMDYGAVLSRLFPNANRRSSAYTKQSRFEGSLRQVRGRILAQLSAGEALSIELLAERTGFGRGRVEPALLSLEKDGLVTKTKPHSNEFVLAT